MAPAADPFGLADGDRIEVVAADLNCRATPSPSGSILGTESSGQLGIIVNGSVSDGGYIWWYVAYDDGDLGWSAEGSGTTAYLENVTNVTSTTNIAYNRTAAVLYAQDYWSVVTSDHYFWYDGSSYEYLPAGTSVVGLSGDDCAHFVSQAIGNQSNQSGGGLNIPSRVPPTYGEPAATNLGDLLINDGWAEPVSSVSQLMAGDLINYEWDEGDNTWDHVALYLGNGTVAMHTDSAFGANWTLGGAYAYRFIHILNGSVPDRLSLSSFTASPSQVAVDAVSHLNVTTSGGTQPLAYSYSGLPSGCTSADLADLSCTPSAAGNYSVTVTVTDSGGASVTGTTALTVTANSLLESISLTPLTSQIAPGGTVNFTALAVCSPSGCPKGVQYVWTAVPSLGTFTPNSGSSTVFRAGATTGTASIEVDASLNGTTKAASPASVTISALISSLTGVSLTPELASVDPGGTLEFNATASCSPGPCQPTVDYLWTLNDSALGTLSTTNGDSTLFTAGHGAGTEGLQVRATYNGTSRESNASIFILPTSGAVNSLVSTQISPKNVSLHPGGSILLFALTTCSLGACPQGVLYDWGTNVSLGTFSSVDQPNVTFTADHATGQVLVTLAASWNGTTVAAMITVSISSNATGPASSGSPMLGPLEIGLVLAVLVVVVALARVLSRRRRGPPPPPEATPLPDSP